MKKKSIKSLKLNKKSISNLDAVQIKGKIGPSHLKTCKGKETCFICE